MSERLKRYALVYREDGLMRLGSEVEANDIGQAIEVARKWCTLKPGRKFVSIRDAVVATPEILDEKVQVEPPGVDNFEELSVRAAQNAVQRGDLKIEDAIAREKAGQNRKSLVEWLESKQQHPDAQQVPF